LTVNYQGEWNERSGKFAGILCAAIGSSFALCKPAQAQVAPYNYEYVSGQSSYTVATNATISVPLYLQETAPAGEGSLLAGELGLSEAGIQATTTTTPSDPALITAVTANSAFDFSNTTLPLTFPSSFASISDLLSPYDSNGVEASVFPSTGVSEVFLGTLTLQAGNTPGQTTEFTLAPLPENFDGGYIGNTFTYSSNYDLDSNSDPYFGGGNLYNNATSSTFDITTLGSTPTSAAPLPPIWEMVLLVMPLLAVIRRRQMPARLSGVSYRQANADGRQWSHRRGRISGEDNTSV
jgi:hypothetical protein